MNILCITTCSYCINDSISRQPRLHRNQLEEALRIEQSLKEIVATARTYIRTSHLSNVSNSINIKDVNSKTSSIVNVDFGERSLKYQQLVRTLKPPSPIEEPEQDVMTTQEREFMVQVGGDVKNALGKVKVEDVGPLVRGFN
jgi:hypothetical protein